MGTEEYEKRQLIKAETLYESLRFAEYDITSGIGEIIDNSIEAKASNIYVDIYTEKLENNKGKKKFVEVISEIIITDNGIGMNKEVLGKSLILGESCRTQIAGKKGIGRFGVGLTLGGISLARRIEVYSRNNAKEKFKYTYIDLDEIMHKELLFVPIPEEKNPEVNHYLENSTGTIIKLKKCDRLRNDSVKGSSIESSEKVMGLSTFIGRTYRKFISAGLNIYVNGEKIFLHDPLYLDGPTRFDTKESVDLKAELKGESTIELEIPDSGGKMAEVKIKMSLLPKEWRMHQGDGGKDFALKRKINENEGISILRAGREVLYGKVEYIIGMRGTSKYDYRDRFWGCEISFPPELDNYFHIRYIKRGAEPIPSLRSKIQTIIGPVVKNLREEISEHWSKTKAEEIKKRGAFDSSEKAMDNVDNILPRTFREEQLSKEEAEEKIKNILDQIVIPEGVNSNEFKNKKFEDIKNKLYSIELVNYPSNIFFETEHVLDKVIIKLNINHEFYKRILLPLCELESNDTYNDQTNIIDQNKFRDAIMLLLLSYSKAETMFYQNEALLKSFAFQWGNILGTVAKEVFKTEKEL